MSARAFVLGLYLCALAVPAPAVGAGLPSASMPGASGAYMSGEMLVRFKSTVSQQIRQEVVARYGHSIRSELPLHWTHIQLAVGEPVEEAVAVYRKDAAVEYAQPNYVYLAAAVPNDPLYGQLWGLKNTGQTVTNAFTQPPGSSLGYTTDNPGTAGADMNIEKAWDYITDCSGVVVAVIDSGVSYNQEDLSDNMWNGGPAFPLHGYNYVNNNTDPIDLNGHGTHVAGTIGAVGNNGTGVTGICWKASIMAVRVLDTTGRGTTATIIQGVDFAVTNGAKVINMSLGGKGPFDQAYSDAITAAQTADVVVVVAAGNDGADNDSGDTTIYPCNFTQPNLVCVAALDQSFELASFSNYGLTSVDVGAPGTNVQSTWPGTSAGGTEAFDAGWSGSSTTAGSGGGWASSTTVVSSGISCLVDPAGYPGGVYHTNTDDEASKAFNLAGADVATLRFSADVDVSTGDDFRGVAGTTTLFEVSGITTSDFVTLTFDISSCISASCTLEFELLSGAGPAARGVAVCGLTVSALALNSTSYNVLNGTSMASPAVAGLATLLRAYNPLYTYADVVSAIEAPGRPAASLRGKSTSGNVVDVMSSLAYVHAPTGVAATVQ
jgi:thermitase